MRTTRSTGGWQRAAHCELPPMTRGRDGAPRAVVERAAHRVCAGRFTAVRAAFEDARRRLPERCRTMRYVIADQPVQLRVVGETLARHIDAPLAHLRADVELPPSGLTIELWDVHETGVAGLAAADRHAVGRSWPLADGAFAASPDGRFVSHELRDATMWLDRSRQRLIGWFGDARAMTLHDRGKPLQMLLSLWASDRGLQPAHAALVAREGRGVVIPGSSGSGKSTLALACLSAGFTYFGDDWVGIGRAAGGGFMGYGLYSSTYLEPAHAARFPALAARARAPRDAAEPKSLIQLSEICPERLGHASPLRALALPRIVAGAPAPARPASKRDALLMLLPSTIFTMRPRAGSEAVDRLGELVDALPAYWVEIGPNVERIAPAVDALLAACDPQ
jgi:hypothetical protein